MRVAVISDIHGNCIAFDAVLDELERETIDQVVCLGDAIQGGAQPAETVERLRELACPVVMGNADAWLLTGKSTGAEGPDPEWMLAIREWSLAQLSADDRAFIEAFKPTVEIDLPGERNLLCFHGSPRSFDDIILPRSTDEVVRSFLGDFLPAFLTGGHTHVQQIHHLGESFYFNPGSIGVAFRHDQPELGDRRFTGDPWAEYAILNVDDDRLGLEFRRAPLDVERVIEEVTASGMPHPDRIISRYRADGRA